MTDLSLMKKVIKSPTLRIVLGFAILYGIGALYFFGWIYPDTTKQPGNPVNWFRDFIWIIYWRWNLDTLIAGGFTAVVLLESILFIKARESGQIRPETLSTYISPILTMGFAYLYMLAIDLGVTYMGDVGFNATWETPDIIWFGFTARELYHNFFFWLIPLVLICGVTNQVAIHTGSYRRTLKTYCVLMGVYSINLGLLDPVVCQILWGNWRLFGDWAMGGADAIFAEGWIAHYLIFAGMWFFGTVILDRVARECREHLTE